MDTMTDAQARYHDVYTLADPYRDEDWGIVSGHHWDRLAAIAGEYARGERTEADMRALVEDTVYDVRREAATLRALDGRTNVAADKPLTPLDLLLGDVVETDGMVIVIDHIMTFDAQPGRGPHPGSRRYAACTGEVVSTFRGGPSGRWNVQGNDLRLLGYVWR
jgi:hypothetical protein